MATSTDIDYTKYGIPKSTHVDYAVTKDKWIPEPSPDPRFKHAVFYDFELPLSSANLFVVEQTQGGTLDVLSSTTQAPDSMSVKVLIIYNDQSIFDKLLVARLSRPGNQNGVGVFEPRPGRGQRGDDDRLVIKFTNTVPSSSTPYAIKKFETDVADIDQRVHDLGGKISFDSISLHGSNANITGESMKATSGSLKTTDGPIKGSFFTSSALSLQTTDATIDVNVNLENDNSSKETTLDAKSADGAVNANLTLTSTTGSGGNFNVSAHTSNDKINVKVVNAPIDSKLTLAAKTSEGTADVYLHPTYEGQVVLKTTPEAKASAIVDQSVVDPTGKGRKRHVDHVKESPGSLVLNVYWGETAKGKGDVTINTSEENATVHL